MSTRRVRVSSTWDGGSRGQTAFSGSKATKAVERDQESITHSEVDPHEEANDGNNALSQIMLGRAPAVARAMAARPLRALWVPAHWLHAVLRSAGAPCFLDNPFSGALVLVAMAVDEGSGPEAVGATLVGASSALLAAVALLGEPSALSSPGLTFNGALIGVTLGHGAVLHSQPWLLAAIALLAAASAWLSRSMAATAARVGLPALNLAFNVLVSLWMAVQASWVPAAPVDAPSVPANVSAVEWGQVATSVLLAPGPVFACSSVTACSLLYVAFLVYSPGLFVVGLLGAAVGSVLGVALCPATELEDLYAGLWSYCPLLTASALGGVFFVLNSQSVLLALVGAATASLAYGALRRALQPLGLPVLAWPFVLSTWMLVGNPLSARHLTPVPLAEVAPPEEARRREKLRQLEMFQQLQLQQQPVHLGLPPPLQPPVVGDRNFLP